MKHSKDTMTHTHVIQFANVADIIEHTFTNWNRHCIQWALYDYDRDAWLGRPGIKSKQALEEACRTTWGVGLDTVTAMTETLSREDIPPPKSRKRTRVWSEIEGEIDVERAITGNPLSMQQMERQRRDGPAFINLICNVANSCRWTPAQMFWRSACTIALVDILEQNGYQCEVTAYSYLLGGLYDSLRNCLVTYRVKEAHDPLDTETMVCGLAPWFFRTMILSQSDILLPGNVAPGHGAPMDMPQTLIEGWIDSNPNVPNIPIPVSGTADGALQNIKKILAMLGNQVGVS